MNLSKSSWIAVILVCGVSLLAVHSTRVALYQTVQQKRARSIATVLYALKCHRDVFGEYPAAVQRDQLGHALFSWRLVLRTFVQQPDRPIEQLDQSWYSSANMGWLTDTYGQLYTFQAGDSDRPTCMTRLTAITGPGTTFGGLAHEVDSVPNDTILLVELADSDIVWLEPRDIDIRDFSATFQQCVNPKGFHVGFADGYVWYLDSRIPFRRLAPFLTVEGAQKHARETLLLPYRRGPAIRSGGWE